MKRQPASSETRREEQFSIESALASMPAGGVLVIPPGKHFVRPGGWAITKPLTIEGTMIDGAPATVLRRESPSASGVVFSVAPGVSGVVIRNIRIV